MRWVEVSTEGEGKKNCLENLRKARQEGKFIKEHVKKMSQGTYLTSLWTIINRGITFTISKAN